MDWGVHVGSGLKVLFSFFGKFFTYKLASTPFSTR